MNTKKIMNPIVLVMAFLVLIQLTGQTFFRIPNNVLPASAIVKVTPCPHHKGTTTSCQSTNKYENYTLIATLVNGLKLMVDKLYFIFILVLLTASHHRRIDRPPKHSLCC